MTRFEDVVPVFWHSANEYGRQPPLTEALVAEAESRLGVTLPEDLLTLLRRQNGGVVADAWDRFAGEPNLDAPFEAVFGIGPGGRAITLLDTWSGSTARWGRISSSRRPSGVSSRDWSRPPSSVMDSRDGERKS